MNRGSQVHQGRKQVVVYGAGDHAKVVLATIEAEGRYEAIGLLDDNKARRGSTVYGYQVLGGREHLIELWNQGVSRAIVAVGDNFKRAELVQLLEEGGFQLVRAVHPTATILRDSCVGKGTMLLGNVWVGADAVIGKSAIASVGVVMGHDCVVGAFAQLCPAVSLGGHVVIGDRSFIGMGATVLPRVTVGRQVVVGANTTVIDDLPDGVTAVGVPARIVERRVMQV